MTSLLRCSSLLLVLAAFQSVAQGTYIPLWQNAYHFADRLEIKHNGIDSSFHSTQKPYNRMELQGLFNYMPTIYTTRADEGNIDHLVANNVIEMKLQGTHTDLNLSRKPVLKHFYKTKANLFYLEKDYFELIINPVVHVSSGSEAGIDELKYINTRGLEVRGQIDSKVGFYTFLTDNQMQLPEYVKNSVATNQAVPREGFYKPFKDSAGMDLLHATGYFTFHPTEHIGFQFGQGRNFIGNGYRSLLLSDFGNSYTFLKVTTNAWRFSYQNIFAQMTGQHLRWGPDTARPRKFAAFHHLSFNTKHVNIGLFEGVVFGGTRNFDGRYLNPIILYRFLEQDKGSPDNAFMGLDAKVNFLRHWQVYGQVMIDELNFAQLRDSTGWWGNKFGFQLGAKYIDALGIDNLDLQGEMNIVRPYTYTHINGTANYTHYNQPIAHPLGANFTELIGIVRYQPTFKWQIYAKMTIADIGLDTTGSDWITYNATSTNWGGNIFLPYTTREQEYQNTTGQGFGASLITVDLHVSYQFKHNLFFDLQYLNRGFRADDLGISNDTQLIMVGIRWNTGLRRFDF